MRGGKVVVGHEVPEQVVERALEHRGRAHVGGEWLVVAGGGAVERLDSPGWVNPGRAWVSLEDVYVVLVLALLTLKFRAHVWAGAHEVGRLVQPAGLERVGDQAGGNVALALGFAQRLELRFRQSC